MFSFHKPKIYRSNLGCCICKAKSSSSRFTDSKKYESEFERCFRINEQRSGEICNACVLLVKRWKKLSPENRLTKHWHHVVDARAGPGTKLTGNRRLTASNSHNHAAGSSSSTSQNSSSVHNSNNHQHHHHHPLHHHSYHSNSNLIGNQDRKSSGNLTAGVLPFSSSNKNRELQSSPPSSSCIQGSSTTGGGVGRRSANKNNGHLANMFSPIDEPGRRSYMTPESAQYALTRSHHMSSLNSKAFESVIKRFRQRQQQQQLEARRRQQELRKRQTLHRDQKSALASERQIVDKTPETSELHTSESQQLGQEQSSHSKVDLTPAAPKRSSRNSIDSIGSLMVDGFRVSSLLDGSLWRKEKICCGIIFRGPLDEVAIIPKLFSRCQSRCKIQPKATPAAGSQEHIATDDSAGDLHGPEREDSPPRPRATKSGSISSCDSNTSGVVSMDGGAPVLEEHSGSPASFSSSSSSFTTTSIWSTATANLSGVGQASSRGKLTDPKRPTSQKPSEIESTPIKPREQLRTRRHQSLASSNATGAVSGDEMVKATKTDTDCSISNKDSNYASSNASSGSFPSTDSSTGLSLKCSPVDRRQQQQKHRQQQQQQTQKLAQSSASRLAATEGTSVMSVIEQDDSDDFEEAMVMDEDAIDDDLLEDASSELVTGGEDENSSSMDELGGEVVDETISAVSVP